MPMLEPRVLTVLMRNSKLRGSSAGVNGKVSSFTIACPSFVCASPWFNTGSGASVSGAATLSGRLYERMDDGTA